MLVCFAHNAKIYVAFRCVLRREHRKSRLDWRRHAMDSSAHDRLSAAKVLLLNLGARILISHEVLDAVIFDFIFTAKSDAAIALLRPNQTASIRFASDAPRAVGA